MHVVLHNSGVVAVGTSWAKSAFAFSVILNVPQFPDGPARVVVIADVVNETIDDPRPVGGTEVMMPLELTAVTVEVHGNLVMMNVVASGLSLYKSFRSEADV
jgi:hypothetical protein